MEIRGSWYLQAHVADRIARVAVAGGTADRTMVLIGMFSFLEDLSRKSNKSVVNHTARALRFRGLWRLRPAIYAQVDRVFQALR